MKRKPCLITDSDRCRLGTLMTSGEGRAWGRPNCFRVLDDRLEDAESIGWSNAPKNLVTMNSTVELVDESSDAQIRATLVYPEDVDMVSSSISVLEPLGTQLLGSRVGDIVVGRGGRYRIQRIVFQPEKAGAAHL